MSTSIVTSTCGVGPEEHPFLEFADRLPPLAEFVASALVGDLQRATPPESRIDPEVTMYVLPDDNQSAAEQAVMPGQTEPRYPLATPSERGAWLDEVGIDHAFMIPAAAASSATSSVRTGPEASSSTTTTWQMRSRDTPTA